MQQLPVAVIGAGPVGLAAAAHLIERGETPLVLEAGNAIGHAVRQWAHVRMFSPWRFNVDAAAARLLAAAGWRPPEPESIPTGGDLVSRYLEPLADLPALRDQIQLRTRVIGVTRKGYDKVRTKGRTLQPFVLRLLSGGIERTAEARAVIDASGTWLSPNPAGSDGLPAIGEAAASDHLLYGIPDVLGSDKARYAGRKTLVLGSGHSALNALLELATLKREAPSTEILWAMRNEHFETAFGGGAADQLPARGALGIEARRLVDSGFVAIIAPFRISHVEQAENGALTVSGAGSCCTRRLAVDEMIVATGFRPDLSFLREIRLRLDPWLESSGSIGPLIDPNLHSCGTVRPHGARELANDEEGFFIAGMKSYGRAPTFLLATGHEQVRSIAAALAGDLEAAGRVELELPATGVCSAPAPEATTSCCGPALSPAVISCCAPKQVVAA